MQPKTNVKLDKQSFKILKNTMENIVVANRQTAKDPEFATKLPREVAIKLTNRCNLRCKHCYQWNDKGHHRFMDIHDQNQEIDFQLIKKILFETKPVKSRLYLWGGEPFCHTKFKEIIDLIHEDPRETILCTNGIAIKEHVNSIVKISSDLELLIAVEGFEEDHDAIRGKGSYKKVMEGIDLLLDLRKQGKFKGKITLHTVIHDSTIGKLYSLMEFFEQKGIDMVILCFPWYISKKTAIEMDDHFKENYGWLCNLEEEGNSSWHGFNYKLNPQSIHPLKDELKRINHRSWDLRIRYQPGLEWDEIEDFVLGNKMPSQRRQKCLVLSTRMDVHPNGGVSACKQFAEFQVGNLKQNSLYEIWNGEKYQKVRKRINNGLMPVCTKCNLLYLYGGDLQK